MKRHVIDLALGHSWVSRQNKNTPKYQAEISPDFLRDCFTLCDTIQYEIENVTSNPATVSYKEYHNEPWDILSDL